LATWRERYDPDDSREWLDSYDDTPFTACIRGIAGRGRNGAAKRTANDGIRGYRATFPSGEVGNVQKTMTAPNYPGFPWVMRG